MRRPLLQLRLRLRVRVVSVQVALLVVPAGLRLVQVQVKGGRALTLSTRGSCRQKSMEAAWRWTIPLPLQVLELQALVQLLQVPVAQLARAQVLLAAREGLLAVQLPRPLVVLKEKTATRAKSRRKRRRRTACACSSCGTTTAWKTAAAARAAPS